AWRNALEPDALFRAGVLRILHAMLERARLGGADSEVDGRRARADRVPRQAPISSQDVEPRKHILRLGSRRRRAGAERAQILSRRFRTAHQRAALPVEITWRSSTLTTNRTR